MHYYSHNIGDYKRDTDHLSLLEHGVYRQLLDLYYLSEKPIPLETEWVFRRLSAKTEEEQKAIRAVLKDFFDEGKDGYHHKRCDMEIREYVAKADTARSNGKLGGRPKKTQLVISGNQKETGSQANQEPITINHKPKGEPRKRDPSPIVEKPEDVDQQVWDDWVKLRKAKRTTVSATAVDGAKAEALKAGMTLDAFLRIWCMRGSQGLQADWLTQAERAKFSPPPVTVPGRSGIDPALAKIVQDGLRAAPPPAAIKEQMAKITGART